MPALLRRAPLVPLFVLLAAPGLQAQGSVLLDQPPNQVTFVFSDALCDVCMGQQSLADDFVVNTVSGFSLREVVVWGAHTVDGTTGDLFTVNVYADAAGLPGAQLHSESGLAHTAVPTGNLTGTGKQEIEYTLSLASPPTLQSGTFWLEVYNTTSNPSTWGIVTGDLDPFDGRPGYAYSSSAPGATWFPDNFAPGPTDNLALQVIGDGAIGGGPFLQYCFGAGCPCGNDDPTAGCANGGGSGAHLSASGTASLAADDAVFVGAGLVPGQPALLIVGENAPGGGSGLIFGDGLRCAGMNVVRLGTLAADGAGGGVWGPGLSAGLGFAPGDVRYFQAWYRDPAGSLCGSGFNLTNGVQVTWAP